jgi:pimeloyl-ACP methyl ester carboxylesterase
MSFSHNTFGTLGLLLALATPLSAQTSAARDCSTPIARAGHYADVNGLRLYYETHGPATGTPVVLIHGALSNIRNSFGGLLPTLSCTHRVIAIEVQAHGHTADIDRPLSTENIADDLSALLRQLRIERADVIGYSMGGTAAQKFAVRHPEQLRRLVVISSGFGPGAWNPDLLAFMNSIDPQNAPWAAEWKVEFEKYAPRPAQWPQPLVRIKESLTASHDLSVEQIKGITVPTLLIYGDRDVVPLENALLFYRTLPHGELALLPNTDHYPGVASRGAWLSGMILPFLDAPAQ